MKLSESHPLAIDIQTTGSTPRSGDILEIGWQRIEAETPASASHTFLIEQDSEIPSYISRLTGIETLDDKSVYSAVKVKERLEAAISSAPFAVIHYAVFERRFLKQWLDELPVIVCTHEIARRTHSHLPSLSLRAVSGYFGWSPAELKRVDGHLRATAQIWRGLLQGLEAMNIRRLTDVFELLEQDPDDVESGISSDSEGAGIGRERRLNLPAEPGVYLFKGKDGTELYIGKAKRLKERVNSYFQGTSSLATRKKEMLSQVDDIETRVVATPLEAALCESDLIKAYSPPYNRHLRRRGRKLCELTVDFGLSISVRVSRAEINERLECVWEWLVGGVDGSPDSVAERLFRGDVPEPVADRLLDAWRLYYGEVVNEQGREQLGYRLWMDKQARGNSDRDPQRPVYIKHLESLTARIRGLFRRVRQARWLYLLVDSSLRWEVDDGIRYLKIRGGEIERRQWLDAVPECSGIDAGIEPVEDLETHDRLAVLTTELRRVLASGRRVQLTTRMGTLDQSDLADLLWWF
jgi:DNA polymerase III epsilon subunit-like protein